MVWLNWSFQRKQDPVVQIENPLFAQSGSEATAATAPPTAAGPRQQPNEQLTSPDAAAQPIDPSCAWQHHAAQHSSAQAGNLRSPAGLQTDGTLLLPQQGPCAAATAVYSSCSNSKRSSGGVKGHLPAPLLLPDDEPAFTASSALSEQGFADDIEHGFAEGSCCTPGTVQSDSPAVTTKPHRHASSAMPAHTPADAAVRPAQHRLSCSTPGKQAHATAAAAAAAASSSSSSPVTLKQPLQQHQQHAITAAVSAPTHHPEDDADAMLADVCSCLGNLQVAADLARSQSGLRAEARPAAVAAVRASMDDPRSSRHSTRSRPSSGTGAPAAAATAGRPCRLTPNLGGLPHHSGDWERGWSLAGAAAVSSGEVGHDSYSNRANTTGSTGTSIITAGSAVGRELARGRSRLQTSTSRVYVWEEDPADAEDNDFQSPASSLQYVSSLSSSSNGSSSAGGSNGLVLLKVGQTGRALPLTGSGTNSGPAAPPSRTTSSNLSGRRSTNSSSSRESSVHGGTSSSSSSSRASTDASAGAAAVTRSSKPAAAHVPSQAPSARSPTRPGSSKLQNTASDAERQQRVLEQQLLQERRQQKQERVQCSYGSCSSPHARSGPSSSKDTPVPQQQQWPQAAAAAAAGLAVADSSQWALPTGRSAGQVAAAAGVRGAAGTTAAAAAAAVNAPASLVDAWANVQASSPKGSAACSTAAGTRPASATTAAATTAAAAGPSWFAAEGLVGSGSSVPHSKAAAAATATATGGGVGGSSAPRTVSSAAAVSSLQMPLPPSRRSLAVDGAPSPRARSAAAAVAAAPATAAQPSQQRPRQ